MSGSATFKRYNRTARTMRTESIYPMGMNYVDSPLREGSVKLLVNYDIVNDGNALQPRGGYNAFKSIPVMDDPCVIHHSGAMLVDDPATGDALNVRYSLVGTTTPDLFGVLADESKLVIEEEDGTLHLSVVDAVHGAAYFIKVNANKDFGPVHGQELGDAGFNSIKASMNNNTFLLYKNGTDYGICRLYCKFENGVYKHKFIKVEPDAVTPSEAVNYGYNMLHPTPYTFANTVGITLRLMGILPYNAAGDLMFSAKINEQINFKLIYQYPAGAPNLKVSWELLEIGSERITVVQTVAQSPTYVPGNDIVIATQPPYKQFSIVAKVYDVADLVNPLKVMQLAAYKLTDDAAQASRNMSLQTFKLGTATGATSWFNKLVLWGVKGAGSTLFLSEVNRPEYFPYPNGVDVLNEEILHVEPYLDSLLVFTNTSIVQVSLGDQGLITKRTIEAKLNLSPVDAQAIKVVKNMVFFRSGNYYFMVVPNTKSLTVGELMIAPIYKPISKLLDTLHSDAFKILDLTYNLPKVLGSALGLISFSLHDYYCYVDNSDVRNCYIYKLVSGDVTRYVEFRLNYNTATRAWALSTVETNGTRISLYRARATENTIHNQLYVDNTGTVLQYIVKELLDAADDFKLDSDAVRVFKNHQVLDTGKRDDSPDIKKRFRELQLSLNNLVGEDLEFFPRFIIDDTVRKDIYVDNIQQITDPQDPQFGLIYIEQNYQDPEIIPGTTKTDAWSLGLSQFPTQTVVKLRIPVSGKGYSARLVLISKNEVMYEILSNTWVHRTMNGR